MKARMAELGLRAADLSGYSGSGAGGRVTIEDLERFMAGIERNETTPASPMRKAVADAMIRSWSRPARDRRASDPARQPARRPEEASPRTRSRGLHASRSGGDSTRREQRACRPT